MNSSPAVQNEARLPASTRIGTVALQVSNLDRSLAFYSDVIGFTLIERVDSAAGSMARLGAPGCPHLALELHERPGARHQPPRGLIGLYHFAVLLPSRGDLARFLRHAVNAGTRFGSAEHLISEAMYLVDPDGITIEVYRDRRRDEWTYVGGEIAAATLPLDVDRLLDTAGDQSWAGLPAGTVMGHVHLYVGDLPRARAFYVDALGFDVTIAAMPGALFVAAGGYHHHVGLNTWAARQPVATDSDAGLLFWELVVGDDAARESVRERLERAGYQFTVDDDGTLRVEDAWGIAARVVAGARV